MDEPKSSLSPVQYFHQQFPGMTYQEIRKTLLKCGIPNESHLKSLDTLTKETIDKFKNEM